MSKWDPNYKRKSKTYTSNEVKDRWNRAHYDKVTFRTGNGGRAAIQAMAAYHGMSMAEYLRHLVIADAQQAEKPEISAILGGGGDLNKFIGDLIGNPPEVTEMLPGQQQFCYADFRSEG